MRCRSLQVSAGERPDSKPEESDDEETRVDDHCATWDRSETEWGDINGIEQWRLHEVGRQTPQSLHRQHQARDNPHLCSCGRVKQGTDLLDPGSDEREAVE